MAKSDDLYSSDLSWKDPYNLKIDAWQVEKFQPWQVPFIIKDKSLVFRFMESVCNTVSLKKFEF